MNFITREYFTNLISIGNASATQDSQLLGNGFQIERLISICERDVLVKLFGFEMYSNFISDLQTDDKGVYQVKDNTEQRWKDLLNGTTYEMDGVTYSFRGLRFSDPGLQGEYLQSLIAYYVYTIYVDTEEIKHTGLTFTKEQAKNAMVISGRSRHATAFNRFYRLALADDETGERSLYQFLKDHEENYPEWIMTYEFTKQNRWGV